MQTNYKIISSYEYDVTSGAYKQVDKEVQDSSLSDFMQMLENSGTDFQTEFKTQNFENNAPISTQSIYALNSAFDSYRFRENESEILKNLEAKTQQKQNGSVLGNLLNAI